MGSCVRLLFRTFERLRQQAVQEAAPLELRTVSRSAGTDAMPPSSQQTLSPQLAAAEAAAAAAEQRAADADEKAQRLELLLCRASSKRFSHTSQVSHHCLLKVHL